MAAGANFVLDKGYRVAANYNSSATDGVRAYRCVALQSDGSIDLAGADAQAVGVVQENVDRAKVATGKVVAGVRVLGITKVIVGAAGPLTAGARLQVGANGGVIVAASSNPVVGILLSPSGTYAVGDLVDVLLTPGAKGA